MGEKEEAFILKMNETGFRLGYTNCMLQASEVVNGIKNGHIHVACKSPWILIEKNEAFFRLYYFLENNENWKVTNELLCELDRYSLLYADLTAKEESAVASELFESLGFEFYRKYIRKSMINEGKVYRKMLDAVVASPEDVSEIKRILDAQFDPMSDHIPSEFELSNLVSGGNVLKIELNNTIAGVFLVEDYGKRSYARTLCVVPSYQNSVVGYSLFAEYLNSRGVDRTKLFYLWVDEANKGVKGLHDRFGYQYDGLNNYVYRRIRENENKD